MIKCLKEISKKFFKKKYHLKKAKSIGFIRPSLIQIVKKVVKEEEKTEEIHIMLNDMLLRLDMKK